MATHTSTGSDAAPLTYNVGGDIDVMTACLGTENAFVFVGDGFWTSTPVVVHGGSGWGVDPEAALAGPAPGQVLLYAPNGCRLTFTAAPDDPKGLVPGDYPNAAWPQVDRPGLAITCGGQCVSSAGFFTVIEDKVKPPNGAYTESPSHFIAVFSESCEDGPPANPRPNVGCIHFTQ